MAEGVEIKTALCIIQRTENKQPLWVGSGTSPGATPVFKAR